MPSALFRDDLLTGQVALVTGGGTGIGAAIARELGHQGATVVIASRKKENIEPAAAGLSKELGREVFGAVLDIRDRDAVSEVVPGIVARHGRLDILINNGGGQFLAPAETIRPRGWDAVVGTNLTGTWNLTRAAADAWMLEHGGRVVSITMLTQRGFPGMAHSSAARAGVEAMTRSLAVEWAPRGINLNCVAPGLVLSSGLRRYPKELGLLEQVRGMSALKRLASCEEVAWLVAYLAGPGGGFITGETYRIDGGRNLRAQNSIIPDPPDAGPVEVPFEPWEDGG